MQLPVEFEECISLYGIRDFFYPSTNYGKEI